MTYEMYCKLFTKSYCLSAASLGFLDFLLLLFLYQDKKSKPMRKDILLFWHKQNKFFKHLLIRILSTVTTFLPYRLLNEAIFYLSVFLHSLILLSIANCF